MNSTDRELLEGLAYDFCSSRWIVDPVEAIVEWLLEWSATDSKTPVIVYMWQHEETGRTGFVDASQVENGWQANNPRLKLTTSFVAQWPPTSQNAIGEHNGGS
jgi:hypothetical protein